MAWPPWCSRRCGPTRFKATCSSSGPGAAIVRHSASFYSEAWKPECCFLSLSEGLDWPAGDDRLQAYPERLGVEGGYRHLPRGRGHELVAGRTPSRISRCTEE